MSILSAKGLQSIISILASLGTVVQLLVLAALALASVVCWGIIWHKARFFRQARRDSRKFLQTMMTAQDLTYVAAAARRFAASPMARMFRTVHQRLESLENGRAAMVDDAPAMLSAMLERVRSMLRLAQTEEINRLEHGLPFLATTASVAPFVGLFGTVWGIMQSFHAIGERGGASLAVVGPGISEALVATAAGLAAAIPAVVAYNHYLSRIRRMEVELDNFADEFVLLFEQRMPGDAHRLGAPAPLQP